MSKEYEILNQIKMIKTKVINLVGPPGTGKSTIASQLFAMMKWKGMDVELVSEYAKELVWEERHETMKNEVYLFGKQHHRLFRLQGKVKYIITDRPLILSQFYNSQYGDNSEAFKNLLLHEVRKFDNFNIFLDRTKPYVEKGRNQTEEESDAFGIKMKKMFEDLKEHYFPVYAKVDTAELILKIIEQGLAENVSIFPIS